MPQSCKFESLSVTGNGTNGGKDELGTGDSATFESTKVRTHADKGASAIS